MSKDEGCVLWSDFDVSGRRPQEAELGPDPAHEEQDVIGSSSYGEVALAETPASADAIANPVDVCLQRAVRAGTNACETDSPEAWRDVISAVAIVADLARTREVVAENKQTARQLTQAAQVAERLAREAAATATSAMQKAEQLEAVAARASETNSDEAWKEAHQMVLALTSTDRGTARSAAR